MGIDLLINGIPFDGYEREVLENDPSNGIDLSGIELTIEYWREFLEACPIPISDVVGDPLQAAESLLKIATGILTNATVKNYDEKIQKLTIRELAFLMKQAQDLDTLAKDIKAVFYKLFEHIRINVLPDRMEEIPQLF